MGDSVPFTNPLVAGLTLIRTAIRSPDYVAGVSGWAINKDGSCEFNNATVRGAIEAGNNTVRLNAGGVKVDGATKQFDINIVGGFLARDLPDTGAYSQMNTAGNVNGTGGIINLHPQDPSLNGRSFDTGFVWGANSIVGTDDQPFLNVSSPNLTGKADASLLLYGQSSGSATDDSYIEAQTDLRVTGDLTVSGIGGFTYQKFTTLTVTNSVAMTNVPNSVLTIPANSVCVIETYAAYNGPVAADARFCWGKTSANVTMDRNITALADSTADNTDSNVMMIRRGDATQQIVGTPNGVANAFSVYQEWAIATNVGATDELIQLQFAQGTANATGCILQNGYQRMQRVA
jgi:hypothetical protein